jgi:hypothetical protein
VSKVKTHKLPKKLGDIVDLLYKTKQDRLKLKRQADELKQKETFIAEALIRDFGKEKLRGARGRIASVAVDMNDIPTIEDADALFKYIKRTGAFDLMQRRLNSKAVEERWADKKSIPGVSKFRVAKVSPHKLGAKATAKDEDE